MKVKKIYTEIITVSKSVVLGASHALISGGDIVFPFAKEVRLKKINRGSFIPSLLGTGIGNPNNTFSLLGINEGLLQTISPYSVSGGFSASNPKICIDDADSEICFDYPVICGGVRIESFIGAGAAAVSGMTVDYIFTFEIEKEMFVDEF